MDQRSTTSILHKDLEWIHKMQEKKRLKASWAVIERMVALIKIHKMEDEL